MEYRKKFEMVDESTEGKSVFGFEDRSPFLFETHLDPNYTNRFQGPRIEFNRVGAEVHENFANLG